MANDTSTADVEDNISTIKSSEGPSSNNEHDDTSTGTSSESDASLPVSPTMIRKRMCIGANIAAYQVAQISQFS
jgi:hypothetical protein